MTKRDYWDESEGIGKMFVFCHSEALAEESPDRIIT